MTEIRTAFEYKSFLDELEGLYASDNFISNFLFAFNNINVGCNCKKKSRIRAAEMRKAESVQNLSEDFKNIATSKFEEPINFDHYDQIILTITNE